MLDELLWKFPNFCFAHVWSIASVTCARIVPSFSSAQQASELLQALCWQRSIETELLLSGVAFILWGFALC